MHSLSERAFICQKTVIIYEVYDVLVNAHPELKTDHLEPYECEDINDYYGFTVSRAPAEINEIDNALREGRLVQLQVHSNEWRDAEGKQVDWPGYHSGLIFYFDGSLYHMKASGTINQKNAVYTREQLIDWIGGTSKQLVIYTKHSASCRESYLPSGGPDLLHHRLPQTVLPGSVNVILPLL